MSASLNLKNPETYRLAKELAEATDASMTAAVTEAIREKLERVRATTRGGRERRVEEILAIAAEMRARAPAGYFDQDFDALLYDEDGLPK